MIFSRKHSVKLTMAAGIVAASLALATGCGAQGASVHTSATAPSPAPSTTDTVTPPSAPTDWPSAKQSGYNYSVQMAQKGAGNTPIPPPSLPPIPSDDTQTGIIDSGGDLPAGEWSGQNFWVEQTGPTTYLYVYAGGKPAQPEGAAVTNAAVLVRTVDNASPPPQTFNTYAPSPDPQGQFKITSVDGSRLTLSLVGTATTYTFDAGSLTFSS